MQIPPNARVCRWFAHAFLTACVNREVSMSALPGGPPSAKEEMLETK
jgi:hypothetical protein